MVITLEQYGAVGDGITDDTKAIKKALAHEKFICATKQYRITELIEFNNVIWQGGSIIVDTIDSNKNAHNVVIDGSICGIIIKNNVRIYDCNIYYKNVGAVNHKCRTVFVKNNNNVIKNCNIKSCQTQAEYGAGIGIVVGRESHDTTIDNCYFDPVHKIDIMCAGIDVFINNCTFENHSANTPSGFGAYGNAIKICSYDENSDPEQPASQFNYPNGSIVKITNCNMGSHGDNCIDAYTGAKDVIITNNTFYNAHASCIEVKCSAVDPENQETHSYNISRNNMTGYGIANFLNKQLKETGYRLYNIIFSDNICTNICKDGDTSVRTNAIQYSMNGLTFSNNIIDCGARALLNGLPSYKVIKCKIENSEIYNCNSLVSIEAASIIDPIDFIIDNCNIHDCTRLFTVYGKMNVFINNSFINCITSNVNAAIIECRNGNIRINNSVISTDSRMPIKILSASAGDPEGQTFINLFNTKITSNVETRNVTFIYVDGLSYVPLLKLFMCNLESTTTGTKTISNSEYKVYD